MKYLILFLFISNLSWADEAPKEIVQTIQFLQPANSNETAIKMAIAVHKYSKEINIDWQLFVSILYQESSLSLDPQNCMKKEFNPGFRMIKTKKGLKKVNNKSRRCFDYGVSQINWRIWGKEMDLDKKLLLTDIDYSIKVSSQILLIYKNLYGKKDKKWFLRYHSSSFNHKKEYGEFIKTKYSRIKKYLTSLKRKPMVDIEEENQ